MAIGRQESNPTPKPPVKVEIKGGGAGVISGKSADLLTRVTTGGIGSSTTSTEVAKLGKLNEAARKIAKLKRDQG